MIGVYAPLNSNDHIGSAPQCLLIVGGEHTQKCNSENTLRENLIRSDINGFQEIPTPWVSTVELFMLIIHQSFQFCSLSKLTRNIFRLLLIHAFILWSNKRKYFQKILTGQCVTY